MEEQFGPPVQPCVALDTVAQMMCGQNLQEDSFVRQHSEDRSAESHWVGSQDTVLLGALARSKMNLSCCFHPRGS